MYECVVCSFIDKKRVYTEFMWDLQNMQTTLYI